METRQLECQFGHKYYKDKPSQTSRIKLQGTRKLGCKAHITTVKKCVFYPEYKVDKQGIASRNVEYEELKKNTFLVCLSRRFRVRIVDVCQIYGKNFFGLSSLCILLKCLWMYMYLPLLFFMFDRCWDHLCANVPRVCPTYCLLHVVQVIR